MTQKMISIAERDVPTLLLRGLLEKSNRSVSAHRTCSSQSRASAHEYKKEFKDSSPVEGEGEGNGREDSWHSIFFCFSESSRSICFCFSATAIESLNSSPAISGIALACSGCSAIIRRARTSGSSGTGSSGTGFSGRPAKKYMFFW